MADTPRGGRDRAPRAPGRDAEEPLGTLHEGRAADARPFAEHVDRRRDSPPARARDRGGKAEWIGVPKTCLPVAVCARQTKGLASGFSLCQNLQFLAHLSA